MKRERKWPKAVFYDSKTTLFDWNPVWIKASLNILNHYGSKIDSEEFMKTWMDIGLGVHHKAAFAEYRTFTDIMQEGLVKTLNYYGIPGRPDDIKFLADLWDEVQPFPDTLPALIKQQEMTKILIFSNVETEYLDMMVRKLHGFKPDFVGDMDQARAHKPSPRAYFWVLEQNHLAIKDVLYCARPQWDVQAAIAVGMKSVWLNRVQWRAQVQEELRGVKPDFEVKDLHGVTEILESSILGTSKK